MSDRLAELRRQRALMQEHLAWLDAEIAAAEKSGAETPTPALVPAPGLRATPRVVSLTPAATPKIAAVPTASPAAAPAAIDPLADKILEEYRVPEKSLHQDVRKGCFLYFAAALLLLGAAVVGLYFALRQK
jgi:hypothetical protein